MEILQLCADSQTKVFVNYFRNSDPLVYKIKRKIDSGYFQKPFVAKCSYNKGMLHTGSHFLNLLEVLFGETVSLQKKIKHSNQNDLNDPNYLIDIKFNDGSATMFPKPFSSGLVFEMEVDFVNGTLKYLNEGQEIIWNPSENGKSPGSTIEEEKFVRISTGHQFEVFSQIANFLQNKPYNLCEISDSHRYVEYLTETIVEEAL
jgi:predicted dehydrogenase